MMINRIVCSATRFVRIMMLLEVPHPALSYLYPNGSDASRARSLR